MTLPNTNSDFVTTTAERSVNGPSARTITLNSLIFLGVVTLYCAWVFSLPLFPTQDGAVHLYYTKVLSELTAHSPLFSQFFAIRYPIPPYAVHYGLLYLLGKLFELLTAEKIVVATTIVSFAYGFRFLAKRIGPGAEMTSFWAIPLTLNWMLGMGFHNYCLSLAFALWAIGVWILGTARRSVRLRIVFVLIVVLMLFTHPVPLFLVLAFVAGETMLRMAQHFLEDGTDKGKLPALMAAFKTDAIFIFLSYCSLVYIALFVSGHRAAENLHQGYARRAMLHDFIRLKPLSLVANTAGSQWYRLALYFMLAAAIIMAVRGIRGRWRRRQLGTSDLLLTCSVGLGCLIPLLPRSMNGSDFFSDRMIIIVWIGALAAASMELSWPKWLTATATLGGCLLSVGCLVVVDGGMRPVAKRLELIENPSLKAQGYKGISIESEAMPDAGNVTFDPYVWAGARYFRRANAVMLNAPWLDLPILPVVPQGELFANLYPPRLNDYPGRFTTMLSESATERERVAKRVDYVIALGTTRAGAATATLLNLWPKKLACGKASWYFVCAPATR